MRDPILSYRVNTFSISSCLGILVPWRELKGMDPPCSPSKGAQHNA